jgi:hypothetical protein
MADHHAPREQMRPVLASLLAFAALGTSACSDPFGGAGHISKKIGDMARDSNVSTIEVARLTSFGWDHMHFFKPGASKQEVCDFIGADKRVCDQIVRDESREGVSMTIAFSLKHRMTHVELHLLENGRFNIRPTAEGVEKSAAVFAVHRETAPDGKTVIALEQK